MNESLSTAPMQQIESPRDMLELTILASKFAIFWDVDETLWHTEVCYGNQKTLLDRPEFTLQLGGVSYPSKIRKGAKEAVQMTIDLFGLDNVHVLTSSIEDYCRPMLANHDLPKLKSENVFPREILRGVSGYGLRPRNPSINEHKNLNGRIPILIDNLRPRENAEKVSFLGGTQFMRYIKVSDFYGVNGPEDMFYEFICDQLTEELNK